MHASQVVKPYKHERDNKAFNTSSWAKIGTQNKYINYSFEGFKGSTQAIYFGVAVKYHI